MGFNNNITMYASHFRDVSRVLMHAHNEGSHLWRCDVCQPGDLGCNPKKHKASITVDYVPGLPPHEHRPDKLCADCFVKFREAGVVRVARVSPSPFY